MEKLAFQQNGGFQIHTRKLVTILTYPQTTARAASLQGSFIPASPGVLVKFLTVKILGRSSLWAGFILPHCLGGDSPWWQCAETPPFSMHQPEESGKHWHSLDFPLCLFYFRPPGHGMAPHTINMGLWSKLPKIRSGVLKGWAWISEACGSLASAPRTSRLGSTERELLGLARMS